jgi:predicted metal-binding protein
MAGRVAVCIGCDGGTALAEALEARMPVTRAHCMNACARPVCLSVREEGKAAYLFGDVDPALVDEVELFLELFDAAKKGIVTDARPLGELRFKLIGRIPA